MIYNSLLYLIILVLHLPQIWPLSASLSWLLCPLDWLDVFLFKNLFIYKFWIYRRVYQIIFWIQAWYHILNMTFRTILLLGEVVFDILPNLIEFPQALNFMLKIFMLSKYSNVVSLLFNLGCNFLVKPSLHIFSGFLC